MARPQKIEREELIDRATEVFWAQGYEATSIPDLTRRMGIFSGSLYNTFGDKNTLFIACLSRYAENVEAILGEMFSRPASPKQAITLFVEGIAAGLAADEQRKGCFITNTAIERGDCDAEAMRIVEASSKATEEALYRALTDAQRLGEISEQPEAQRRALAQTLVSALHGLRVTSRTASDPAQLHAIARTTLSLLN